MHKQTVVLITASTGISFLMDLVIYSSAQGKLKLPPAKELLTILAVGVVMGVAIDFTLNKLKRTLSTTEENELNDLVEAEVKKIRDGEITNKQPTQIVWMPKAIA